MATYPAMVGVIEYTIFAHECDILFYPISVGGWLMLVESSWCPFVAIG
jgi:hypothetical protein